jgi:hypothetical protein
MATLVVLVVVSFDHPTVGNLRVEDGIVELDDTLDVRGLIEIGYLVLVGSGGPFLPVATCATAADLAAHEADTTVIHGITDTSLLLTTSSFGPVTPQTTYGAAPSDGAAATVGRSDHAHGTVPSPPAAADYTLTIPAAGSYAAQRANGSTLGTYTDTGTTSGLRAALTAILAERGSEVHVHFSRGRFHFLDAPTGVESWASVEDHMQYGTSAATTYGLRFTGEGQDITIVSNRTNYAGATDTEPFSFTNCRGTYISDMTVESCGAYKSTTDAIDCDQGSDVTVERVLIRRSRARGIVVDGGDPGRHAVRVAIRQCRFHGRPQRPGLLPIAGGSLAASTLYDYALTWVDSDLGGVATSAETKPSAVATYTTDVTNKTIRVFVPRGPYTCTATQVYRRSTPDGGWVLIGTVSGNTGGSLTDTGLVSLGAAVFTGRSTIFDSAIEMLGTSDADITGNFVDGTGDATTGATQYGINLVRKSSVPTTSDRNRVIGNSVRQTGSHGIRIAGGNNNVVALNVVANPGTVAVKAQAIRIEGIASAATNRNLITRNRCLDDQTATSPSGGVSMNNAITVTATNTPTSNVIEGNILTDGASATVISDSGTTSIVRDNPGHNPQGPAAITVTASPMTYTAGSTPEVVYVQGGVVSSVTKAGTTLASVTGAVIPLEPNEAIVVTYSAAPTMVRDRK